MTQWIAGLIAAVSAAITTYCTNVPPPVPGAYLPSTNPTLTLWLDATDPTSVELAGTSILAWQDKSVNAQLFQQPVVSNQLTYIPNAINFQAAAQFVQSKSQFMYGNNTPLFSPTGPATVVAVTQFSHAVQFSMLFAPCYGASTGALFFSNTPGIGQYQDWSFNPTSNSYGGIAVPNSLNPNPGWHYIISTYNGSSYQAIVDGVTYPSVTAGGEGGGDTISQLGNNGTTASPNLTYDGLVSQVMTFNSALTGSDLTNLETWITNKYGSF